MPISVCWDNKSNVLVSELAGSRIRIIRDGVVTTLAGGDEAGWADGPASRAKFSSPHQVCVDRATDMIYVADSDSRRIRKIDTTNPSAVWVSTVAGTGSSGCGDGDAVNTATFTSPTGLAVSSSGALAVSDTVEQKIRWVSLDGFAPAFSIDKSKPIAGGGGGAAGGSGGATAVVGTAADSKAGAGTDAAPPLPPNYRAKAIALARENAALKAEIEKFKALCKCGAASQITSTPHVPPTTQPKSPETPAATPAATTKLPSPALLPAAAPKPASIPEDSTLR